MGQVTTGAFRVLSNPSMYNLFQIVVGAKNGRKLFVNDVLKIKSEMRVLDIGCGTAEILEYLPKNIEYYGFDLSPEYINAATKKYANKNIKFRAQIFDSEAAETINKCDIAYASGLLHHLDDLEVKELFKLISSSLKPGGKFISVDPCFTEHQNFISRYLINNDRGKNIRNIKQLNALAIPFFNIVNSYNRNDFLRIPYDHAILECYI